MKIFHLIIIILILLGLYYLGSRARREEMTQEKVIGYPDVWEPTMGKFPIQE